MGLFHSTRRKSSSTSTTAQPRKVSQVAKEEDSTSGTKNEDKTVTVPQQQPKFVDVANSKSLAIEGEKTTNQSSQKTQPTVDPLLSKANNMTHKVTELEKAEVISVSHWNKVEEIGNLLYDICSNLNQSPVQSSQVSHTPPRNGFEELDKLTEIRSAEYAKVSRRICVVQYALDKVGNFFTSKKFCLSLTEAETTIRVRVAYALLKAFAWVPYVPRKMLWILLRLCIFLSQDASNSMRMTIQEVKEALSCCTPFPEEQKKKSMEMPSRAILQVIKQIVFHFDAIVSNGKGYQKVDDQLADVHKRLGTNHDMLPSVPVVLTAEILRHSWLNVRCEENVALFLACYISGTKKETSLSGQDVNYLWRLVNWGWVRKDVTRVLRRECGLTKNTAVAAIEEGQRQRLLAFVSERWVKMSPMNTSNEAREDVTSFSRTSYIFSLVTTVRHHVLRKFGEQHASIKLGALDEWFEGILTDIHSQANRHPNASEEPFPFTIWVDPVNPLREFDDASWNQEFRWLQYESNPLPEAYVDNVASWIRVFSSSSMLPLYSGADCVRAIREISVRLHLPGLLENYYSLATETRDWIRLVDVSRVAILCLRGGLYVDTDLKAKLSANFYRRLLISSSSKEATPQPQPFFLMPVDYSGMMQNHFMSCANFHPFCQVVLHLFAKTMNVFGVNDTSKSSNRVFNTLDATGPLQFSRAATFSMKLDSNVDPILQLYHLKDYGNVASEAWEKMEKRDQINMYEVRYHRWILRGLEGFLYTGNDPKDINLCGVDGLWNMLRSRLYLLLPALFYGNDRTILPKDSNMRNTVGLKFIVNVLYPSSVFRKVVWPNVKASSQMEREDYDTVSQEYRSHGVNHPFRESAPTQEGGGSSHLAAHIQTTVDHTSHRNFPDHDNSSHRASNGRVDIDSQETLRNLPMAEHTWDRTWWNTEERENHQVVGPYEFAHGPYFT